jgi:hypothetical protein
VENSFTTSSLIQAAEKNIFRLAELGSPQAARIREELTKVVGVLEQWKDGKIHPSLQERNEILDQLIELNRKAHTLLQ